MALHTQGRPGESGPITTGLGNGHASGWQRRAALAFGVMGPGLRQDDTGEMLISSAPLPLSLAADHERYLAGCE